MPEEKPLKILSDVSQNPIFSYYAELDEKIQSRSTFLKTKRESAYDEESLVTPYNSDDLYEKTGDYSIYEEMRHDDQVSVSLQLKKDLVLAGGWDIEVTDESQGEVRDDLINDLKKTDRPLMEYLEDILTAYEKGFSGSEKVFARRDGKLVLKDLRTRNPVTWLIHLKDTGPVDFFEQLGVTNGQGDLRLRPSQIFHYVNRRRFMNPYGQSDLRDAHNAWFFKTQIFRYYGIFCEKYASPFPIARYDKNAPDTAVDAIFNAIKQIQQTTAIAIPKDIELELVESKGAAGDIYTQGISLMNVFIGRALLLPDLLGFTGSETGGGSFALGQKQFEMFFSHIRRRRQQLEDQFNKEIIKPLCAANYGLLEDCPTWKLGEIDDENAAKFAEIFIRAVQGNVYKPTEEEINHFRRNIKFPEGEVTFGQPEAPSDGLPELAPPDPGLPQTPEAPGEAPPQTEPPEETLPDLEEDLRKMGGFGKGKKK